MAAAKKTDLTADQKLELAMRSYLEGNLIKNKGATQERNALKDAQKEFGDRKDTFVVKIDDKLDLEAGYQEDEAVEIDPKLVMQRHPEQFWELVSIAMTNATEVLGEKNAALCSVPVKKRGFKIKKVKK